MVGRLRKVGGQVLGHAEGADLLGSENLKRNVEEFEFCFETKSYKLEWKYPALDPNILISVLDK